MNHHLENTISLLERTPPTLNALLRNLPDVWVASNEGEKTWNVFDVVGHLIHGERTDWMLRTRIILQDGDKRPFDRFDRWAQQQASQGKSLPELLDEFARLRAANLDTLRSMRLTAADLSRHGMHPELGKVTLSQLLATWAAHDLTHLHQISRI